jgi:hypothetical protein
MEHQKTLWLSGASVYFAAQYRQSELMRRSPVKSNDKGDAYAFNETTWFGVADFGGGSPVHRLSQSNNYFQDQR